MLRRALDSWAEDQDPKDARIWRGGGTPAAAGAASPTAKVEPDLPAEIRLADMKRGRAGRISRLDRDQPDHVRKLLALGVLPGADLELEERGPAFVFRLGWSTFAVDAALARSVWVLPAT